MALDVRIFISIFISVGALADGCGVSSRFATSLLNLPFFARGVPQRAADVHGLPTRPDISIPMPNIRELRAPATSSRSSPFIASTDCIRVTVQASTAACQPRASA